MPLIALPYTEYVEPRQGELVVDIGASIGGYTIPAAKKVGQEGKVFAVEPEPNSIKKLRRNIFKNNVSNIKIIKKAVWNQKREISLFIKGLGCHSLTKSAPSDVKVQADTLDGICTELNIKKIDILKMDIEGAEIEALEGAEETLKKTDKVVIASYHMRNGNKTINTVKKELKKAGFELKIGIDETGEKGLVYGRKNITNS